MNEIYTRISVRKFKSDPVEKEKITAVLRAAMQAPSAGNQQPWEFFENTWAVEDEGVRFFILAGIERALVIDAGRSGLDIRSVVKSVTSLPFDLLITHADPDHTAGNRFFSTFYMHPSEAIVYYNLNGGTGDFMPVYDGDVMDL